MSKLLKSIAIVSVFSMLFAFMPAASVVCAEEALVDPALALRMENAESNQTIPVSVFFKDDFPEEEKLIEEAEETARMIREQSTLSAVKSGQYSALVSSGDAVETLSDEQLLVEVKRAKYAARYTKVNADAVATMLSKSRAGIASSQVTWQSQYSPLVKMSLTKSQIAAIAAQSEVAAVYLDDYELELCETTTTSTTPATPVATWQQSANITYLHSLGYTGAGVKVGHMDGAVVNYDSMEYRTKTIFETLHNEGRLVIDPEVRYIGNAGSEHAVVCSSLIAATDGSALGVAPGVTLYSTTYQYRTGGLEGGFEWLLSQGVRVISISLRFGTTNQYDYSPMWLDHIAIQHDVTVVAATGNGDDVQIRPGIAGDAMSYNAISVGAIDDRDTASRLDDILASFSDYYTGNSAVLPRKPDLVAPGDTIMTPYHVVHSMSTGTDGTSLSTPIVAGIVALLYQIHPALESKQAVTKAILLAGISRCGALMGSSTAGGTTTAMLQKTGAGEVDAKAASYITSNNRYVGVTMGSSVNTYTKTFTVSSSDTLTRVALTWLKNNRLTGTHVTSTPSNPSCAVLYLTVTAPNGTVYRSQSNYGNVQLVSFTPPVSGTYTITVTKVSAPSDEPNVHIGLAWY